VWAKTVRPRVILLENVEEFEDWGPLGPDNRPDPARIGLTFRIWKGKLEALGYKVEHREIVAAVYGAPTTRKRLYLIARCDGLPIVWPKESTALALTDRRLAADCIDWSLPTYSIFLTKREAKPYKIIRPLADNTMRRIARGLQKFVIDNPTPFIVPYWGGGKDRRHELSAPLRTVMADPRYSLVTPYVARIGHTGSHRGNVRGVRSPISTITSKAEHLLCAPTLIQTGYGERKGQLPRALNLQKPLGTVVGGASKHALVAAFLAKHNAGHEATGPAVRFPDAHRGRARSESAGDLQHREAEGHREGWSATRPAAAHGAGGRQPLRRDPRVPVEVLRARQDPRWLSRCTRSPRAIGTAS
jgi:DNA (cytosine-5)-methyltransferase 1